MLSSSPIKAGGAGISEYFDQLAKEDYWVSGGEPQGRWIGQHAERLGLSGNVQQGELGKSLRGFHPQTGEALAKNAGDKHHGGYDLTFSAPKSVSVVWSAADQDTRKAISEAQQRAVESALAKAERDGAFRTLHGHAGAEKRDYTGGLCAATFEHSTSRNGDPQLHTHTIVANLHPDGRRLDFDTRAKMALGAAYRAELAQEMQKLGFTVERDKSSFRIVGVDKQLEKDMSSRRAEILEELKEKGLSGGKASAAATLATRTPKGEVDREQLFARAQLVAESYGLNPEKIAELRQPLPEHERTPERIEAERMPDHEAVMRQATEQASTLTPRQLETLVMQEAQGRMGLADAEKYLAELKQSEHLIELRDQEGNTRYTSAEMFALERQLADRAAVMASEKTHAVAQPTLDAALTAKAQQSTARALQSDRYSPDERAVLEAVKDMTIAERDAYTAAAPEQYQQLLKDTQGLSDEQRKAYEQLTSASRMVLLEGTAGTGKSYLLDSCRHAWQQEGYKVIGGALAAKAARGLKNSSSIESRTLHSTLARIESGKIQIDNKTVFVVDEAGMAGSRLMSRLQDHLDKSGAKLVIVGDTRQIQPVDAGGAMRAQRDALERAGEKYAVLNEIRRQTNAAERQMVLDAKAGNGQAVLDYLQKNGRIIVYDKREDLQKGLARQQIEERMQPGRTSLAMAETNAETYAINVAAREMAKEAGMLSREEHSFSADRGERAFSAGDRLYFLKNDDRLGVDNGSLGTVEKSEDGKLSVILDDGGGRVEFSQEQYKHVDWGYCATIDKSQGDTVDSAGWGVGNRFDAHLGYVVLSRHRDTVKVHMMRDQLETFAQRLSTSHAKDTSAAYQKVEKYQGDIDRAEARVNAAEAEIAKLEKQIQRERQKLEKAQEPAKPAPEQRSQRDIAAHADNKSLNNEKEQQNARPEPQPDRYAGLDPERLAASRAAAVRVADRAGDAPARPSESLDAVRDVSRIDLVHDRVAGHGAHHEVHVPSDERHHLAAEKPAGDQLRREGAGDRQADRGAQQSVAPISSPRLDMLEKQLAEARADLKSAVKDEGRARDKQAAALDKAKAAPAERSTSTERSYPKFEPQPKPNTEHAIERDADLARKALDSHRSGEKLPEGKALDKAIKSGELRMTKDSEGRVYVEDTKNGKIFAQDLNRPDLRRTESRNINHLGLTKQKFKVIDKKVLGFRVGSIVMKSGGTIKAELAGKLRDKLQSATAGKGISKAAARAVTKPLDNALKRGERWQRAGAVESAVARLQMKVEQRLAERQAVKAMEAKIKAAEKPKEKAQQKVKEAGKVYDKATDQAKAPNREREPAVQKEKAPDLDGRAGRETQPEQHNDLAERAEKLANRDPGDKSADRASLRDNGAQPAAQRDKPAGRAPQAERETPPEQHNDLGERTDKRQVSEKSGGKDKAPDREREPAVQKDKPADRAPHAERENPVERIDDIAERAEKLANRDPGDKSADRAPLRDNGAQPTPVGDAADRAAALASREPPAPAAAPEKAPAAKQDRSFER